MPIKTSISLAPIGQREFARLDYRVMRQAWEAIQLGRQRLHLLTPEAAFRVTALTDGIADYERHLRLLLNLTPLRAIQWANLARNCVQLKSLVK